MAVQPGPTEKRYAANGVTTIYAVPFLVIESGDLKVYLNGVLQTSGYTQTGTGQPISSITFTVPPTGDLYLVLEVPFQRLGDYQENGDFLASTINRDFDRIWQALKQLFRGSTRALTLGETDVDGFGAYRAKGNRISSVADPVLAQDATTMGWVDRYIAGLLSAITGPINNALNIFYKAPDGSSHVVQDLSTPDAPILIGARKIDGTASNLRVVLDEIINKVPLSEKFQGVTYASGVMTLDASVAQTYGGIINENITTLNLIGATAGRKAVIDVIFGQPLTVVQHSIAVPTNTLMPVGVTTIMSNARQGDITIGRFSCTDGVNWFYQRLAVYQVSLPSVLPSITNENATFNDEGTSTTGWTATNVSMAVSGSILTFTKSASGSSNAAKAIVLPGSGAARDFIIYGKCKASATAGHVSVIWLFDGTAKELGLWFGTPDGGTTAEAGAISLTGYTTSQQSARVATASDYQNSFVEYALHYDSTFACVTCYFKDPGDGLWYFKARVLHTWFTTPNIRVQFAGATPVGASVTMDYLTIAKPNLMAIGDSICAGSTGFNPDPALALTNYLSTWMHYSKIYPLLRNNLVVNKGRGGKTSAQTLAAISDVTNQSPQLVFLHASTNDPFQSITKAQRTANIQATVNAITAASGKTILLNSAYGAQGSSDNTTYALRDYCLDWWVNYRLTVTGLTGLIDIMQPVLDGSGYMGTMYLVADQLHPNALGYQKFGEFVASS